MIVVDQVVRNYTPVPGLKNSWRSLQSRQSWQLQGTHQGGHCARTPDCHFPLGVAMIRDDHLLFQVFLLISPGQGFGATFVTLCCPPATSAFCLVKATPHAKATNTHAQTCSEVLPAQPASRTAAHRMPTSPQTSRTVGKRLSVGEQTHRLCVALTQTTARRG